MGKHNKVKHRAPGNMPAPGVPYPVQNRILREHIAKIKKQFTQVQRMLWVLIHAAPNKRLEIDVPDYEMAMQCPPEDAAFSTEHDKERKKIILVLTDEEGKRLEESDPPLIVEA